MPIVDEYYLIPSKIQNRERNKPKEETSFEELIDEKENEEWRGREGEGGEEKRQSDKLGM